MNVLIHSKNQVLTHLGGYQIKTPGRKYRLNKYCVKVDIGEEGTLMLNVMTGALVHLKPYELTNIFTNDPCDYADFMVNNYFIVPEDFNEQEVVKIIKNRYQIIITPNYLDHPNGFTILTTTTCNARCFYCYERNAKGKHPMTEETAEKVARYIITYAPKGMDIRLDWFGGEPLYNEKVIDIITSRVASAGFKFHSSMISNGYLFNKVNLKKAREEWQLRNIQITLDGTEEVYNKVKNYIYKDVNPFKTVIENIHKLLEANINVSIRMNADSHNVDNLLELIEYLNTEFPDHSNLFVYVWPIFEEGFKRTPEQRIALYNAMKVINQKLFDLNFEISNKIDGIKGLHCQVDSGDGVTISPSGDLGLCEHYIDSDFWGHIDNPIDKNMDIIKEWRNYSPNTEICNNCPLVPNCVRMTKCPDEVNCSEQEKDYMLFCLELALKQRWEQFKNQKSQECEGNCQTQNDSTINCPKHNPCLDGPAPNISTDTAKFERVVRLSNGTLKTETI